MGDSTPVLGVCLGHQSIGQAYGGDVVRARRAMHGKVSPIRHTTDPLFGGLPERINVTRYHSLIVDRDTLPDALEVIAWTDEPGWEDEIQALRHRTHPVWGVQFHPESIASEGGMQILRNFLELS
jgi:anthranilate synthase component 2